MSDVNKNPDGGNSATPKKENDLVTIVGGVELTVTHLPAEHFDESALKRLEKFRPLLGTSEVVKVRQVPISQMSRYGNAVLFNEEGIAIEIYCGKDPGWADTLEPASVNAIADKGLEINLLFFSAWYQRQARWKKPQQPEAITQLLNRLADLERKMALDESRSLSSSAATPSTTG
jgi:hypothetical protein